MAEPFSAESRPIHAGTARTPGEPGWEALEEAIGGLEDAQAVAFASGQAASMALMLALAPGRQRIFEAWLALRGLKTLPLRIARQSDSALAIATHLARHPRVTAVHYPGIDTSTAELARRQLPRGSGPLLSFEVAGADAADKVVASARLILPATSFGGVESTWERRGRWPAETAPAGLIRLSVGVEPAADLITDIDQALEVL